MFISRICLKGKVNLNSKWWNLRIYDVGYRGEPISPAKRMKPPEPVTDEAVKELRGTLQREYNVMRWLANPYLSDKQEKAYVEKYGTTLDIWKEEKINAKHAKMPSKPKKYTIDGRLEMRCANVGNLLHNHRRIEDTLKDVIRRERWD